MRAVIDQLREPVEMLVGVCRLRGSGGSVGPSESLSGSCRPMATMSVGIVILLGGVVREICAS